MICRSERKPFWCCARNKLFALILFVRYFSASIKTIFHDKSLLFSAQGKRGESDAARLNPVLPADCDGLVDELLGQGRDRPRDLVGGDGALLGRGQVLVVVPGLRGHTWR